MLRETTISPTRPPEPYISYEAYLRIAPEDRITEWVDGRIIYEMPASPRHQLLLRFLNTLLSAFVDVLQLGEVGIAPFEAKLWPDGPSREPDLMFISTSLVKSNLDEHRLYGGPDLAIEIVSKSSVKRDNVDKLREYERAGVQEYWIFDPRPRKETARFYVRGADGRFIQQKPDKNGIYRSTVLDGFWLDVNWLWQKPLPNPKLIEADVMRSCPAVPAQLRQIYDMMYAALNDNDTDDAHNS